MQKKNKQSNIHQTATRMHFKDTDGVYKFCDNNEPLHPQPFTEAYRQHLRERELQPCLITTDSTQPILPIYPPHPKRLEDLTKQEMIELLQAATNLELLLNGINNCVGIALGDFIKDAWAVVDAQDQP